MRSIDLPGGVPLGGLERTRRDPRSHVRPRIPLAYAGLLIVALVAVVGFAAFSPAGGGDTSTAAVSTADESEPANLSARVASAILALRISDTSPRVVSTTTSESPATTTSEALVEASLTQDVSTSSSSAPTTLPPSSTTSRAPTTTTQPKDTTPPALTITSPSDGDTVSDRVVTFEGTAEPGALVYSGPYDANVKDDGSWTIKLVISSDGSTARITAEDDAGNTTTKAIVVTYEPPSTNTTTTTSGSSSPTTTAAPASWSPLWPADAGGQRDVEYWRPLVEKYWPDYLVNCALNIIHWESRGNPRAYNSSAKAEGLFQHLSKYWKARAAAAGFRDSNGLYATPYSAEANIAVSWYLASNSPVWDSHWSVDPRQGPLECTE